MLMEEYISNYSQTSYFFLGENQDCRMLQSGYADFLEFDDAGNPREISHLFWQNDVDEEVPYRADYSPNSQQKYWKV